MNEQEIDKYIEKGKSIALKVADKMPLPLHYILNGIFIVLWMGDLVVPDPLPFIDELLGAGALYYYNAYILRRTYGVINPFRILRGESPVAKRRLGLLPYEQQMGQIKARLKSMKKAARGSEVPGLDPAKVKRLAEHVKQIEKRLHLLDRLLTKPAFQEGEVKVKIARIEARIDMTDDEDLKQEYKKAMEHAGNHLKNIERLREERNRLVAKLERFHLQLDDTYSRVVAMAVPDAPEADSARLFDELFASVSAFDETLKELEAKPSTDLYQAAVKEIEETEAKAQGRISSREPAKTAK